MKKKKERKIINITSSTLEIKLMVNRSVTHLASLKMFSGGGAFGTQVAYKQSHSSLYAVWPRAISL